MSITCMLGRHFPDVGSRVTNLYEKKVVSTETQYGLQDKVGRLNVVDAGETRHIFL